jgi:Fe-S cluster biogenesis protein NfuA
MEEKIKQAIDKVRPALQMDGGDVAFVGFDPATGIVKVSLSGMCVGCPMSQITLKQGIEAEIKAAVPEVKEVVAV